MKHVAFARIAFCVLFVSFSGEISAQAPRAAYGSVLFDETLEQGTAQVKVVEGDITNTQSGLDVILLIRSSDKKLNGKTRRSRTDDSGVARFIKLAPGTTYIARVVKKDEKTGREETVTSSEPFNLPKETGARILLSLSEPGPAVGSGGSKAASAPMASGAGSSGIPPMLQNPRKISGVARGEQKDPPGQLTVRAVQGSFRSSEAGLTADFPVGTLVHLVSFTGDGSIKVVSEPIGKDGRVTFKGLERGSTSYYAMSLFPRGDGFDRLVSKPVQMPPQVGMRMMLAGEALDSKKPLVDDLPTVGQPGSQPGGGEVTAHILVAPEKEEDAAALQAFELVDVVSGEVVAKTSAGRLIPRAQDINAEVIFMDAKNMPQTKAGSIGFGAFRPSTNEPLGGVKVAVSKVGAKPVVSGTTSERGLVVFEKNPLQFKNGQEYVVSAEVRGKSVVSKPFTYSSDKPHAIAAIADWAEGDSSGRFSDVPKDGSGIYYVRTVGMEDVKVSIPFQLSKTHGAAVNLYMYPDVLFGFHASGEVEDDKIWFQVQLLLQNPNQIPYAPKGGVHIPLPVGFKNASVPEEMGPKIKILPKKGITWRGAVPPGTSKAVVTFNLPVEDGNVKVDWDLPNGLLCPPFEDSAGRRAPPCLVLSDLPGTVLTGIPKPVEPRKVSLGDGRGYLVVDRITIPPGKRLSFAMSNLPQPSLWQRRLSGAAGLIVLAAVFLGIVLAVRTRLLISQRGEGPARMRRERLLDQLVQLESRRRRGRVDDGEYELQRARLMEELEALVDDDELGHLGADE